LEALIRGFIKNMSKEEKRKMLQEFMNSMNEEEKTELIQLMMPIVMKSMKPSTMATSMMNNFNEDECKKMITDMPPEMRQKCVKIMTNCLKTLQDTEKTNKP
jgi:flagellar motor switch protein FliG